MSAITTHVLDTSRGRPAGGVPVVLEIRSAENGWRVLGKGVTDDDGRLKGLLPAETAVVEGTYRLTFDVATYFRSQNVEGFYPEVVLIFAVRDGAEHYHVPLLLNPYGYTTYRGS